MPVKTPAHRVMYDATEEKWYVKKDGETKVIEVFFKKDDAVSFARKLSKKEKTELIIHGEDGKIQSRDSHGNDPHPPKG